MNFNGHLKFSGEYINIISDENKLLFDAEDVANAVGYSKFSSLDYHASGMYKERAGGRYLTLRQINKIAKAANRTPKFKEFAKWAKELQDTELAKEQAAAAIAKIPKELALPWPFPVSKPNELISITEASVVFGMHVGELSDWLVAEGYADRYVSNCALKWSKWFKEQGYGARPIIKDAKGERESNIAKLTSKGLEYIQNRLKSQRENGVLAFGAAMGTVNEKIEDMIKKTFKPFAKDTNYRKAFGELYELDEEDLIKAVKAVVAEVKLKELK